MDNITAYSFANSEVGPAVEDIYRSFRPLVQFYMTPKHFKKAQMTVEPGVFLRGYL